MYKLLLITHFFGLSIGAGTGIYMAALSAYAAKTADRAEAGAVMLGPGGAISRVGSIGLVVLLLSGVGMIAVSGGAAQWGLAFWVKMALVALIIVYVANMKMLAARAREEAEPKAAFIMKKLGPVGPILAVFTISAAVLAFQ